MVLGSRKYQARGYENPTYLPNSITDFLLSFCLTSFIKFRARTLWVRLSYHNIFGESILEWHAKNRTKIRKFSWIWDLLKIWWKMSFFDVYEKVCVRCAKTTTLPNFVKFHQKDYDVEWVNVTYNMGEQLSHTISSEQMSFITSQGGQLSWIAMIDEQLSSEQMSVGEQMSSEQMSYLKFRVSNCRMSKCQWTFMPDN